MGIVTFSGVSCFLFPKARDESASRCGTQDEPRRLPWKEKNVSHDTQVSLGLFLITGTIGYFSALTFNVLIFSSIKVD